MIYCQMLEYEILLVPIGPGRFLWQLWPIGCIQCHRLYWFGVSGLGNILAEEFEHSCSDPSGGKVKACHMRTLNVTVRTW